MAPFNTLFWRRWHRWVGFPAALFLLFAASTGFLLAFTEFFGADEALREATRDRVSPVTLASPLASVIDPLAQAITSAKAISANAPVDKIHLQFKGDTPTVTIFTGKLGGGEDRKLVFDARTGALITNEGYADKPLLNRLHSGEALGDGGLVVAMFWALSLIMLTISGLIVYYTMRGKRALTGINKIFW